MSTVMMEINMTSRPEWISMVKNAEKQGSEEKPAEHLTKLQRENLDKTKKEYRPALQQLSRL